MRFFLLSMLLPLSAVSLCAELAPDPSDGSAAEFIAMRSGFGTLQTIAGYIDISPNFKVWTPHSTVAGGPWRSTTLELSTTAKTEFYRVSETNQ